MGHLVLVAVLLLDHFTANNIYDNVFETVGGINTVLRTKAAVSIDEMGDQYCMIGPFVEKGVKMEVEVEDPIKFQPMAAVIKKMTEHGFRVRSVLLLLAQLYTTAALCEMLTRCCQYSLKSGNSRLNMVKR